MVMYMMHASNVHGSYLIHLLSKYSCAHVMSAINISVNLATLNNISQSGKSEVITFKFCSEIFHECSKNELVYY